MEDLMDTSNNPDIQAYIARHEQLHDAAKRMNAPHVMRRPYARWWRPRPRWVWMSIGAAFTAPVGIAFGFIIGRFV
jgi:hypothetical protein